MSDLLHIYAQQQWHDEAFVIGDREALTALRDALNAALNGRIGRAQSFTADGEGFDILVVQMEPGPNWQKLQLPYTDEMARDQRETRVHPWDMFRKELTEAMKQDKPCGNCKDCTCQQPEANEALKHLDDSLAEIEGRIKTVIGEAGNLDDAPEPKRHLWTALEHIRAARRKTTPQEGEKTP